MQDIRKKRKKGSNIFLLLGILLIIVAVIVMLYAYNFEKHIYGLSAQELLLPA